MVVGAVVLGLGLVLGKTRIADDEKVGPYECGFDTLRSARLPFSLRFFLLAVIFLIFDVEIVLLFPLVGVVGADVCLCGASFVSILVVGLFHEWREGSLDWG